MKHEPFTRRGVLAASLAICFGLSAGPVFAAEDINPHADEILRSMSNFLAGTKAFSVSADTSNEILTLEGQKLQFNSHSNLIVERPSGFLVNRQGRFADVALFFDGAALTLYGKTLNAYVQKDVPGTLDDAIHAIERETSLSIPGADLLLSDPYAALSSDVTSSGYYGKAYIGGVECDHLAFRTPTVDWQLWVKAGDEPLPMKYVITTKWMTGAPQYSVRLSDWNIKPVIAPGRFNFSVPTGAVKVEALPVDEAGEITVQQENK
jgi:hypothetical protein